MSYKAMGDGRGGAESRNQENTLWIGNLDPQVTEPLLYELTNQFGIVKAVSMPVDKVTGQHNAYGFVEYSTTVDCVYAQQILHGLNVYGRQLRVNRAGHRHTDTSGLQMVYNAIVFVGNIAETATEKQIYDTFSLFGNVVHVKLASDSAANNLTDRPPIPAAPPSNDQQRSSGYAFVTYDLFVSADAAIESMNGQFMENRQVTVSYAYLKLSKTERHGSPEERMLEQARLATQAEQLASAQMFSGANAVPVAQQHMPPPPAGMPMPMPSPMPVYNNMPPPMQPPQHQPMPGAYPAYSAYPPPQMPVPQQYPQVYPTPLPPGLQSH